VASELKMQICPAALGATITVAFSEPNASKFAFEVVGWASSHVYTVRKPAAALPVDVTLSRLTLPGERCPV
jgi:hypothetical protein